MKLEIPLTVTLAVLGVIGGWLKCYDAKRGALLKRVTGSGWLILLLIGVTSAALVMLSNQSENNIKDLEIANESVAGGVVEVHVLNRSRNTIEIDKITWRVPGDNEFAMYYERPFDPPVPISTGDIHPFRQNISSSGSLSPALPFVLSFRTTKREWVHKILSVHTTIEK